jgi:threonyl-tRNA synthetase
MKVIMKDGSIREGKFEEVEVKNAFCHTAAHILAQAVKRLYPETKCAIGSSIKKGFYYDFEFSFNFTEAYLPVVENEMKNIVEESFTLQRIVLDKREAITLMQEKNESYKVELIKDLEDKVVISFFKQGNYIDLCEGPHVTNTCYIKTMRLLSVAGAYWRGDEHNTMLTRIYGTAFQTCFELQDYLVQREEAKLRDHRKLGRELKLFAFMEQGPGFPFFLPKGQILKNILIENWRRIHEREGYVEISTPIILNRELWETSGHWEHYRENMYTTQIDEVDCAIKPMNCPGGMLVYKMEPHSYRDLPIRMGELGLVHRHEKSGQLHGLMRARSFTQDDAHIFMTKEQITDEIKGVVKLIDEVYRKFGFKYHIELSTRPQNSIGSDEDWELATTALEQTIQSMNLPYEIKEGDGAFYGPKIDFHLEDSIGRTWQCGTIQLDFQLPLQFGAEYVDSNGVRQQTILIHRVVFGSIERFMGILIEHYAGKFPVWLAPIQIKILSISKGVLDYASEVYYLLKNNGMRCEMDERDEKLGYKIREAQMDKVPYMVIIGQKEKEENLLSVRKRDFGDLGAMAVEKFLEKLQSDMIQ